MNAFNEEQQAYWRAADKDVLLIGQCFETGRHFFYPRERSPFTAGPTRTIEASGFGEVYSFSIQYRTESPYCLAYVRLDEGPIMLTNIVAETLPLLEATRIGARVRAVFRDVDGRKAPFFECMP